uniref:YTH domain-containing family protein n=1 Tax=Kalanchoe fedtschenkoi TaxID=63787 RepID=A0A7N0U5L3_KALFE
MVRNLEYWQLEKWNGCFSLKWHIVKEYQMNYWSILFLRTNKNRPVTNNRDTQEASYWLK